MSDSERVSLEVRRGDEDLLLRLLASERAQQSYIASHEVHPQIDLAQSKNFFQAEKDADPSHHVEMAPFCPLELFNEVCKVRVLLTDVVFFSKLHQMLFRRFRS